MKKREIIRYWDNVRWLTIDLLDVFPDSSFDFRPVPEVRTVCGQFDHILSVELYMRWGLIDGIWTAVANPDMGFCGKEVLRDRLIREHEETSRSLYLLPEDAFTRIYQTRFGTLSGEGLIYLAIDEEIHHRGNLYVYSRILGIEPPQMVQHYGEIFRED